MRVKNANGTSELSCSCGSWENHWVNVKGEFPKLCQSLLCSKDAEVGAHVIKVGGTDQRRYIVPLCKGCNAATCEFSVPESKLVSANVQQTCG